MWMVMRYLASSGQWCPDHDKGVHIPSVCLHACVLQIAFAGIYIIPLEGSVRTEKVRIPSAASKLKPFVCRSMKDCGDKGKGK